MSLPVNKASGFVSLRRLTGILSDKQGFTLGEMVAVLGVVGIMMLIAVPNYVAMQPGLRLNGAAREVFAKVMWARSKAVEENTTYTVSFPTDHTFEISKNGTVIQTVDIQANYSGVTLDRSGGDPTFNGRGTADRNMTITMTNSSGSKEVEVKLTGNVRIN